MGVCFLSMGGTVFVDVMAIGIFEGASVHAHIDEQLVAMADFILTEYSCLQEGRTDLQLLPLA